MSAGNNNSAAPLAKRAEPCLAPLAGLILPRVQPPLARNINRLYRSYRFTHASTDFVFHIFESSAVMVSLARHWK